MFNNPLFKLLTKVIGDTQKNNRENPDVETADESVFDHVRDRAERAVAESGTRSRSDMYRDMADHVREVKKENEANPNVITAHSSVFDDMMKKLEEIKAEQEKAEMPGGSSPAWTSADSEMIETAGAQTGQILRTYSEADRANYVNAMAMTNSFGGSLALRLNPDFGAPSNSVRIPDQSQIKILSYSDKAIILDGKKSNWVQVEFGGQQGWILDSYIGGVV